MHFVAALYKFNLFRVIFHQWCITLRYHKKKLKTIVYLYIEHDNVRRRWPTRKYSKCWRTTRWEHYYINSWCFIFTIWSLDWKLKSSAVSILINLDCKYLETQALRVYLCPLRMLLEQSRPQWKLSLLLACRAFFVSVLSCPSALEVALGQMFFLCVFFMALLDSGIWLKKACYSL